MNQTDRDDAEATARSRYMVLNAVRVVSLAMVMLGIAVVQGVIDWPEPVGVLLAVIGLVDFFFAPAILAKRWKAGDRERGE